MHQITFQFNIGTTQPLWSVHHIWTREHCHWTLVPGDVKWIIIGIQNASNHIAIQYWYYLTPLSVHCCELLYLFIWNRLQNILRMFDRFSVGSAKEIGDFIKWISLKPVLFRYSFIFSGEYKEALLHIKNVFLKGFGLFFNYGSMCAFKN